MEGLDANDRPLALGVLINQRPLTMPLTCIASSTNFFSQENIEDTMDEDSEQEDYDSSMEQSGKSQQQNASHCRKMPPKNLTGVLLFVTR